MWVKEPFFVFKQMCGVCVCVCVCVCVRAHARPRRGREGVLVVGCESPFKF